MTKIIINSIEEKPRRSQALKEAQKRYRLNEDHNHSIMAGNVNDLENKIKQILSQHYPYEDTYTTVSYVSHTIEKSFEEASNEIYRQSYNPEEGVSSRMILHMCKARNITCIGYDQNENTFVKHIADSTKKRKFKPIYFYLFMGHFYIITDPDIIKSMSAIERENNGFKSSIEVSYQASSQIMVLR
jgi:hypothetical protein